MSSELKSGLILSEGEEVVVELEAEFWAGNSNPLSKLLGSIQKFFAKIFGYRKTGFVVITNKRVIQVTESTKCYCFTAGKNVKYILPSSIKEVGYTKEDNCCCCCPSFYFYFEAFTEKTAILITESEEYVKNVVDAFYNAIAYPHDINK